jgi:phosphatidylserine/phosphatidylglycerophosphate/cardiolipin synthase-like enzyme
VSNLISNKELASELEFHLPKSIEVTVITAFFTKPAYDWFSKLIADNSPNVSIVGRFSPKDFIDGASSFEAVRLAVMAGYNVKLLPNLHAKIYQIDEDIIFTGSANMTGKGLSLVENSNLEACTRITSSLESKEFINKIINSAVQINLCMIEKMEEFIRGITTEYAEFWPEKLVPLISELFVSDFPLSKPGTTHQIYRINTVLDFALIEAYKDDFTVAQKLFKKSKAYRWLKNQLIDNNSDRDLGFGKISSLIHDALTDDPIPYRSEIKEIQANLYKYISLYAMDEIEIYVPGRKSEILRLL